MTDEAKAERREWDEIHKKKKEADGPFLEELGAKDAVRSRDEVLNDFEKISGPLRGQNRDQKPKG